ncbi:MAG: hypothetical protein PHW72_01115 [Candidatus Pacebacteria bacterium]|nr:hypothetical protein [Candidatus Paceibacterota bacterium]
MNKKISAILLIVSAIAIGFYFWRQSDVRKSEQADERDVRNTVENFGKVLKNVSLLSSTASQDIEQNYKDFLDQFLLLQWKNDPSKAPGRLTSSPWPDGIEILSLRKFGSGAYEVRGNIVEITSVEQIGGGIAVTRPVDLGLVKFNNQWLIASVNLGEYSDNDIKTQLRECLPKSDMASLEKCSQLLKTIRNFDDCILAGFSSMESNPPQCALPDGRIFFQETNSTWEAALQSINNCEIEKVFQTHSRIVTLMLKNGNRLIATEPNIDDVIKVVDGAAARCGEVPIGTE